MSQRVFWVAIAVLSILTLAAGCGDDDSPSGPGDGGGTGTPAISSILPPGASSGIQITISGSNFGSAQGTGKVEVAGEEATVDAWSDTEIKCTIPAGLSESLGASVALTTGSGQSSSSQMDITPPNTYKVTSDHPMDHYPCWSPGADWIYFSSTRSGGANWDIYRIPATGGVAERVTYDDAPDFYPDMNLSSGELAWSSKMRHINNSDLD